MTALIASSTCRDCVQNPSHLLLPCKHRTCSEHYTDGGVHETILCGICRDEVKAVTEIKSERATDPAHRKNNEWSVGSSPHLFNSLGTMNGGRDRKVNPPLRNIDSTSPTPAPPRKSGRSANGTHSQQENGAADGNRHPMRYVPPPLRNAQSPNARPESSISNATFASQPPTPMLPIRPPFGGNLNANRNTSAGYNFPYGSYRLIPDDTEDDLNQRIAAFDPFVEAQRSNLSAQRQNSNTPARSSFGNDNIAYGIANRNVPQHPLANVMAINPSPSNPSPHDSVHANGSSAHMSRAARIAALIRSGATEDEDDINYGNPGPDKRLPPEQSTNYPGAPVPRGKVAAGYTGALVSYSDAEANTKGNPAAFLGVLDVPRPQWLVEANRGHTPAVEDIFDALPMIEGCRYAKPSTSGFVHIDNIPYASTRSEIVAFLGRNAQIISQPEGSPYLAVHVMMDRHTAKTNDVYVEVKNPKEAAFIVSQFDKRRRSGRGVKIGDRDVTVQVASQGEFMASMFPRAKNVEWYGPVPRVSDKREYYYKGIPSSGFQGFLQNEEITYIAKHAENPQHSPFATRVPCRNYEALITLLHKYPWHALQHVLLEERQAIFLVTLKCMRYLMGYLREEKKGKTLERNLPTNATLQELVVAAMTCPGFSEGQKATFVSSLAEGRFLNMTNTRGMNFRFGGVDKFSQEWPFHALIKLPGVPDDVVEYVASMLRRATTDDQNITLAQLHSMRASGSKPPMFDNFKVHYKNVTNLADLGAAELRAIEEALSRVLPRRGPRSHSSHTATHLS